MDENAGRETLHKLIELQIDILTKYKEFLRSPERYEAKEAINKVVKAVIEAAAPVLTLQKLAYDKVVDVHEKAVDQTKDLLENLLKEEDYRATLHEEIRRRTEGGS